MEYKQIPLPQLSLYSVSESGVVINNVTGKIRKPNKDKYGYLRVSLYHIPYHIHKLVALTYIGFPPENYQINHKDKNKDNNHYSNLEWVTLNENLKHKYQTKEGYNDIFTKILCYKDDKLIKEYDYVAQVREDGFRASNVSDIIHGRGQKTSKGYRFVGIK